MDTTKPSEFSTSPTALAAQIQKNIAPLVIDVRKNPAYLASEYTLPNAIHRDPMNITTWVTDIPINCTVVVYCVHGHEVSQEAMTTLRKNGIDATYLHGGIENWRAAGLPILNKNAISTESTNGKPS
jgi:rhodanese-related sulfurtransferase